MNWLYLIWFWYLVLIPLLIYFDARRNKIGLVYKTSPGFWAMLTKFWLLAYIIPVVYLFKRKKLLAAAKANPVEAPIWKQGLCYMLLVIFTVAMSYFTVVYPYTSDSNKLEKQAMWRSCISLGLFD